jgi:cyclically-permuted mutarotase family protein
MLTWSLAAQFPGGSPGERLGLAGVFAGVDHGVLLVAGGSNFPAGMPWKGGKKAYYSDIVVLQKDYRWVATGRFRLPRAVAYGASATTPEGVVCIGGENEQGVSGQVWLLQWDPNSSEVVVRELPSLPEGLGNAAAAYWKGRLYVAGGETTAGVSDEFFCLDMHNREKGWIRLPELPGAVSHTVLVASGDRLFLIGGRKKNPGGISDLSANVYAFDDREHRWARRQSLPYDLSAGTGLSPVDGKIWLFGGDRGETFHHTERLIAEIATEKNETRKKMLLEEKERVQTGHPGFSREILQYDVEKDDWTVIGRMPFPTPVTTTVLRWGDRIVLPGGETKAGVRTPDIRIAKFDRP